jgi:pilus assembly protein CpaB
MRLASILIVTFALLLAGAIFFVVPRLMSRGAHEAQLQQRQAVQMATNDVLVAARNLPAGTVLKADDMRWQRWPQDALDPSFLVREKGADLRKDAVGHVVLRGLEQGAPVTPLRLLKPGDAGFLAAALTPGMRAVAIKIDAITGTAGFVLPADRVDVLLTEHYTLQTSGDAQQTQGLPQVASKDVTSVVLRDIKVLAVDQAMQDIDSKPKLAGTATLEVDLVQAEKLALAAQMGTLSLALRSYTAPMRPEPERGTGLVEDFQVSPFRAAVLQRSSGSSAPFPERQPVASGGGSAALRVYHGASLARGTGQ